VLLSAGLPAMFFGAAWSAYYWAHSIRYGTVATTGTVMIGILPIVLGFQMFLQAVVLDVGNEPRRTI
jgi:uncharacterized membrane protein